MIVGVRLDTDIGYLTYGICKIVEHFFKEFKSYLLHSKNDSELSLSVHF